MTKLKFSIFIICVVAVLFCTGAVFAQNAISPEKKALILEIKELNGMQGWSVKVEMNSTNIGDALMAVLDKEQELTDAQKQELKKIASEGKERLEKQMGDFVLDKTLSSQLFDEVFIQLFDKNFTESELLEMVVFYRTATGQKASKFMRGFVNQLNKSYSEAYSGKLKEFANSKLQEEIKLLEQKIKETKSRKNEG